MSKNEWAEQQAKMQEFREALERTAQQSLAAIAARRTAGKQHRG